MAELRDIAQLVRSKNAGPFQVTFDIIIGDRETYREMKERGALSEETFARIYDVETDAVTFIEYDEACAFKATIPRVYPSGDPKDGDIMGGQQHGPLVTLEVDVETG